VAGGGGDDACITGGELLAGDGFSAGGEDGGTPFWAASLVKGPVTAEFELAIALDSTFSGGGAMAESAGALLGLPGIWLEGGGAEIGRPVTPLLDTVRCPRLPKTISCAGCTGRRNSHTNSAKIASAIAKITMSLSFTIRWFLLNPPL
jgi:hypothetical protein